QKTRYTLRPDPADLAGWALYCPMITGRKDKGSPHAEDEDSQRPAEAHPPDPQRPRPPQKSGLQALAFPQVAQASAPTAQGLVRVDRGHASSDPPAGHEGSRSRAVIQQRASQPLP